MARVLRPYPEPEDPAYPKGSLRRAWWRTLKESLALSGIRIGARPIVLVGMGMMIYHWGVPHLLMTYRYSGEGALRVYHRCDYVGWQPFTSTGPDCPLIVWVRWRNLTR